MEEHRLTRMNVVALELQGSLIQVIGEKENYLNSTTDSITFSVPVEFCDLTPGDYVDVLIFKVTEDGQ